MSDKLKGWKELPLGCVIEKAGNSDAYETGSWRTYRPVLDSEKCTNCLLCWIYCPDSSVRVENEKVVGFDLNHCKGCGICRQECPVKGKAISMKLESELE